ncbi:hypothetical protein BRC60_01785 [Halobacteriales archaeon QH_1_68_42]|nr:MAG: hypothetical protein BRC60_01785 [Halobacteriales archaeon QH_1_68_42]
MSEDQTLYATEPNRVLSSGAETLDAIGLAFLVRSSGITIEARTGQVAERVIELDYDDVQAVEHIERVAHGVRIETVDTEYTVTNLTSSAGEARDVVAAVRDRTTTIRSGRGRTDPGAPERPSTDRRDRPADAGREQEAARSGERVATDGSTAPNAEGADRSTAAEPADDPPTGANGGQSEGTGLGFGRPDRTFDPGETFACPLCEKKTVVPDRVPEQEQDIVCPGCESIIGQTPEDRRHVRVDMDASATQ